MCSARELKSLLPHRTDNYGALHFDISNVDRIASISASQFEQFVERQIEDALHGGETRSMWFRIASKNARLIEPLVKAIYQTVDLFVNEC